MPEYWLADEPAEIAETLFGYHPDLTGAKVGFVFKEKATKNDGVAQIGKAFKVPDKYQPLMMMQNDGTRGFDFMIVIGADAWSELGPDAKRAWIDHLLEHCYGEEDDKNGSMKWKLRRPSISAFPIILRRHGIQWDHGASRLAGLDLGQEEAVEPEIRSNVSTETEPTVGVSA